MDDDPSVAASLQLLLKQHGYETRWAEGPEQAAAEVQAGAYDLVLQDMNFSNSTDGRDGMALLLKLRALRPGLPVILITAWGSITLAVEGIKAGAADFVTKPWSNAQVLSAIETCLSLPDARKEPSVRGALSRAEIDATYEMRDLVGQHPAFLRALELAGRVAATDATVLITGESGTGKERVAEAIHRNSARAARPFVKVNLGGISSTLFESEMFGHLRGAFTDARETRRGRFEVAQGGSIFLDEIGDLELSSQVKLLRVLQDRTYEVLGSSSPKTVDVRVVSATNRDLRAMIAAGEFREDLYYRLNLIEVRLPALRERASDIPLLTARFLEASGLTYGRTPPRLAGPALDWLAARRWPGNVRQLRQMMERIVLVLDGGTVEPGDLESLAELEARDDAPEGIPAAGSMTLDEMERRMIEVCLAHYQGNLTRAAQALGLSRTALYRRLRRHGLPARSADS